MNGNAAAEAEPSTAAGGRPALDYVRKYYRYDPVNKRSYCKLDTCPQKKFSLKDQHGGNLTKHVMNNHPIEALAVTKERRLREERKREAAASTSAGASSSASKRRRKSASAVKEGHITIKMDGPTLRKATATLCSVNGRPSKIVEDSGLRMLLDPILEGLRQANAEDVPEINRQNVRMEIAKEAEELREEIREEVKGKLVCLKLDTASRLNRKILCINIQYAHNGAQQLRLVGMIETFESHTSAFLKDKIMETLSQFGIPAGNVYTGTTDNASNVKKAVSLLPSMSLEDTLTDYGCHHSVIADTVDEAAGRASDEEDNDDVDDPAEVTRSASALSNSPSVDESDSESDGDDGPSSSEEAESEPRGYSLL